jgi:hypothetical protein
MRNGVGCVARRQKRISEQLIQVGSLLRFRGLVFNDNGALRMDAGQIYDGVPD